MENQLLERIQKRLVDTGLTASEASRRAGLSEDAIRNLTRGRSVSMRADSLAKLAPVLETSVEWLLGDKADAGKATDSTSSHHPQFAPSRKAGPIRRDLPIFGLAAGSVLGALAMTNDPVDYVPRPDVLARVKDAYGLFVTGTSMEPRYFAGDVIFIHPYRPIRQGDHVVIQEARSGGTLTTIKRFERETDTRLITTQYNPPAEVSFDRASVMAVHRVLTSNELFGV